MSSDEYKQSIELIISNIKNRYNHLSHKSKWILFKVKVKEVTIKLCIKKAKEKRENTYKLELENNMLGQRQDLTHDELIKKNEIQQKLNDYYDNEVRGAQIRARIETIEKGEASSKFFKSIESTRQSRNVIYSLKQEDGTKTSETREILSEMGNFYENLYASQNMDSELMSTFLDDVHITSKLSEEQKLFMDRKPEPDEMKKVIEAMKINKSPGIDGIPVEFYKVFWNSIEKLFSNMVQESWENNALTTSMNTGILTLIHKGGDHENLKNYRPISLTNCDYKIIAFVFAERLQHVISDIIHTDQSGYIRGRFIGCNIRNIIDIYEYTESFFIGGLC